MANILIIGALPRSLLNFRGELIKKMISDGHSVTAMSAPASEEEVKKINKLGAKFISFEVDRNGVNPFQDIRTLISLRAAIKKNNTDIVLSYTIKPVIWGGIALFGIKKVKFFALITGLGFAFDDIGLVGKNLKKIVSFLYKISLINATKVIFQNHDDMNMFIENKICQLNKCFVVQGSGVDAKHFSYSTLPDSEPSFILIARLLQSKGVKVYVEAAKIIKDIYPAVKFKLLGPTDPSPDGISKKDVDKWHAEGWIEYLGETENVKPYLESSHVFVLPSFYGEGLPRTIIEAMAIGRPIITTDNVGCRDTVVDGYNGFLVPIKDAAVLVEKIVWMLNNRDQWQSFGNASRKIVEDKFDVHLINQKMLDVMNLSNKEN